MNNFWKKDKKEHFFVGMISAFICTFILHMVALLLNKENYGIADMITIVLGIIAVVAWELLRNRTFSVGDMKAGTLGILAGIISHKIVLIIGLNLIG